MSHYSDSGPGDMAGAGAGGERGEAGAPTNGDHAPDANNITSEEYDVLDIKLDELNSALDFLEQKNDDIHAQLVELLHSNREIREQLKQETEVSTADQQN